MSLALAWFFHKDSVKFNDRNELWSDRAGYYIYLPATFFYGFDARSMPADLDIATGGGFSLDTVKNKVDTKYTYGVALMIAPFFATAHLVSLVTGYADENGFSMIYMRMMLLAAVVYLMLGLWFLHKFLVSYFSTSISLFVVVLIFFGTNLFYYSLPDGLMSHLYSFFLFSLFLFSLKKFLKTNQYGYFLLICLSFSLAVLVRPTNIILGLAFLFLDAGNSAEVLKRLKQLLSPRYGLLFLVILFLIFLPQMVYWKYLSGSWLHFSYRDEGFVNWRSPKIAEVLFSPVNGLLTYTPMVIFMLAGLVMMFLQKRQNRWLITCMFVMVTMICASWKMWYFGCSYGQRSFIEYFTLLAIPLGWLLTGLFNNRFMLVKTVVFFLLLFTVYANIRYIAAIYRFDRCYYGSTWDWDHYFRSFSRAGVFAPQHQIGSFENDFENLAIFPGVKPSKLFTHSGQYSVDARDQSGETSLYSARLYEFGYPWPKTLDVELWVSKLNRSATGATLGFAAIRGKDVVFSDFLPLDSILNQPLIWSKAAKSFIVPEVNDSSLTFRLYISNPSRKPVFADDLNIIFNYHW
jgi:hypothetical protein